jgi:coenzyme F420-reducing hydrogenase alpha subunit
VTDKRLPLKAGVRSRRVDVDYLARVEGEGALLIDVVDGELRNLQLRIFEPPRFFEAFLAGREFQEAVDITSRICGICPVAYMMSAAHAMEDMLGFRVDEGVRRLRRLLYCAEWIQSHVLHIFLLHAPDFLGYQDAMEMAKQHGDIVKRGLRMKKAGNEILKCLGGREIHPINVRVGGFYKIPAAADLRGLLEELRWARDAAAETARWTAQLEFPELHRNYDFVALRHASDYPFSVGRIVCSDGLDIAAADFLEHFDERHVAHSNALHAVRKSTETSYCVGPLARFNLNRDRLSTATRELAHDVGFDREVDNPFESIVVRAIEVFQVLDEAVELIETYEAPPPLDLGKECVGGVGIAATEAPRGLLYHRYEVDSDGLIRHANIIPPTSQNQLTIEEDLGDLVRERLSLPEDELTWVCEQAVRNYDPCISCATHFLRLQIRRGAD